LIHFYKRSYKMRLTQLLTMWPKTRPKGAIWSGKQQMVRKVEPWHLNQLNKDIQREKKNAHICLNPCITPEQERVGLAAAEKTQPRKDQLLFRLRKAKIESTTMAPTFVEDNIKHLKHNISWEWNQFGNFFYMISRGFFASAGKNCYMIISTNLLIRLTWIFQLLQPWIIQYIILFVQEVVTNIILVSYYMKWATTSWTYSTLTGT